MDQRQTISLFLRHETSNYSASSILDGKQRRRKNCTKVNQKKSISGVLFLSEKCRELHQSVVERTHVESWRQPKKSFVNNSTEMESSRGDKTNIRRNRWVGSLDDSNPFVSSFNSICFRIRVTHWVLAQILWFLPLGWLLKLSNRLYNGYLWPWL